MTYTLPPFALCVGLAACLAGPARAQVPVPPPLTAHVEVFTNASILLTGAEGAKIFYLDGIAQLEEALSRGLPANSQQAADMVKQRARSLGPALQARAMNAAEGMTRAAYYGVKRVPAVVFDGKAIVYGVADIGKARSLYAQSARRPTPPGMPQ